MPSAGTACYKRGRLLCRDARRVGILWLLLACSYLHGVSAADKKVVSFALHTLLNGTYDKYDLEQEIAVLPLKKDLQKMLSGISILNPSFILTENSNTFV